MKMRLDRVLLRSGYIASLVLAAGSYITGFGLVASLGVLLASVLLTRVGIYMYFERFLAFKAFEDFTKGKIRHECIACGASCHLRVNLGKDDVERVLTYAKDAGIKDTVVEKSGSRYWLKRKSDGSCVFLTYSGNLRRCSIYSIRPIACRLYPLIPAGIRLKVDPLCPGLSRERGHTFKEHLTTQEVGSYVRKVMGKI
jgi:Fe-S-cluster containining protein